MYFVSLLLYLILYIESVVGLFGKSSYKVKCWVHELFIVGLIERGNRGEGTIYFRDLTSQINSYPSCVVCLKKEVADKYEMT